MATLTDLRPFRDYDEHDVIALFTYKGGALDRGRIVKVSGSGWQTSTADLSLLSYGNGKVYNGAESPRWELQAEVSLAGTGDIPLGMTLYEVSETDENGELLKFNPRKQDEKQAVLSGQAVPVATKGWFLYSGTINGTTSAANVGLWPSGNGQLTTNANWQGDNDRTRVGKLIGSPDGNNWSLIYLNIQ